MLLMCLFKCFRRCKIVVLFLMFLKLSPEFESKTKDNGVCFVQLDQPLFKQCKFDQQVYVVCCFRFIFKIGEGIL